MRRLLHCSRAGALACALALVVAGAERAIRPARRRGQGGWSRPSARRATRPIRSRAAWLHRDGWRELIGTMVDLAGSPEQQAEITPYLAAHFPPNDRRAEADAGRGRDRVQGVAGADARAALARSGRGGGRRDLVGRAVGHLIGKIDPATGAMTEYPLPAGAMPHTVTSMTPATSGTPATRTPRSACSTRKPGRSPSTRCPIPRRRTRTPRCSMPTASSGSRCSRAT